MAADTKIEWCHATFNPWQGCQRVSPGCEHCYAEALSNRFGHDRWGPTAARERTTPAYWRQPINWNRRAGVLGKRMRVFCASMADVFEDRPEITEWRRILFDLIDSTPNLDWLLLTKRPENFATMLPWSYRVGGKGAPSTSHPAEPWPNVWLGTTIEDQQRATERIPALIDAPAVRHFVSCEPLLEPVRLRPWERGIIMRSPHHRINWVIVGGESGHGARPFNVEWARALRKESLFMGAAFFMKQLGSNPVAFEGFKHNRTKHDRLEGFPVDLCERAFP